MWRNSQGNADHSGVLRDTERERKEMASAHCLDLSRCQKRIWTDGRFEGEGPTTILELGDQVAVYPSERRKARVR
jgi:hypothetical protein